MPIIAPTPITNLPTPPSLSDLSTFSARTDAFISAMPAFGTQSNNLASNVLNNANEAYANALLATDRATAATEQATIATSAAGSAGAAVWVSGTPYAVNDARYSPLTYQTYRRVTAGAGTVDPSRAGPTVWVPASVAPAGPMIYLNSLYGAFTHV